MQANRLFTVLCVSFLFSATADSLEAQTITKSRSTRFMTKVEGDFFGESVSGAGDVNGEGLGDFIVGAANRGTNGGGYARVFVSQVSEPVLLGDCNQDGVVNFFYIAALIKVVAGGDFLAEGDIDQDGVVGFLDIRSFVAILAS